MKKSTSSLKMNKKITEILIVLFVIWALVEAAPTKSKWKCNKQEVDDFDRMFARAIVIGTEEKFPTDKKSLEIFCR